MELTILDKQEKPLLSRLEIKAEITYQGPVPTTADVKKALASSLKADETLLVVKHIYPIYKNSKASVIAYHYKNKDEMKRIEPAPKKAAAGKPAEKAVEKTAPKK